MIDVEMEFPTITPDSTPEEIAAAEAEAGRLIDAHNARLGITDEVDNSLDDKVENFNENHDPKSGRFSSGKSGGGSGAAAGEPRLSDDDLDQMADDFFRGKVSQYTHNGGDGILKEVYKRVGFDAKPKVLSVADYENDLGAKTEVFRGISEPWRDKDVDQQPYANDFRYGKEHFPGIGIYGNGSYTSPNFITAKNYSNNNSVVRMSMNEDAREITFKNAELQAESWQQSMRTRASKLQNDGINNDDEALRSKGEKLSELAKYMGDPGVYAAAHGYDYLLVERSGEPYFVLLNRGAVTVAADNYRVRDWEKANGIL